MTATMLFRALASPLLVAGAASVVLALSFVHEVAATLQRAHSVRAAVELARTELVADAVAQAVVDGRVGQGQVVEVGDLSASVQQRGGVLWITTRDVAGGERRFACTPLPGAAPRALAAVAAVVDPELLSRVGRSTVIGAADLPQIDEAALAKALSAEQCPWFQRDQEVALRYLEAGTDGDDHVLLGPTPSAVVVPGDLVVVPGHLWLQPGREALELNLADDLVVVVRGNLYVGRSLRLTGPGRLSVVTVPPVGAVAFADRDGDGRWSPGDVLRGCVQFRGPVEGGGNVYFGLGGSDDPLEFGAALVAAGEVHLAADTRVAGPLVLPFGVTQLGDGAKTLVALGAFSFLVERERLPGLCTSGPPRLSRLRTVSR